MIPIPLSVAVQLGQQLEAVEPEQRSTQHVKLVNRSMKYHGRLLRNLARAHPEMTEKEQVALAIQITETKRGLK